MMICRVRPHGYRIRPSQGDGGIDVCVPASEGHVEIYQVKKFASNLTSGQQAQIKRSHARVADYAKQRGWTIDKWHLVLPLDPTPGNTTFLEEEVQAKADFPCFWVGLPVIEGWVALYPEVVDYYLNDWNDRLKREIADFLSMSSLGVSIGSVQGTSVAVDEYADLSPALAVPRIEALARTLNRHDPHYTFEIHIVYQEPTRALLREMSSSSGAVAISVRQLEDCFIVFAVVSRCVESQFERPIQAKVTLEAKVGSDAERDLREFRMYGRIPDAPFAASGISLELPGGLGGQLGAGNVAVVPSPLATHETVRHRYTIIDPDGVELASLEVVSQGKTVNYDNTGLSLSSTDASGVLTLEVLSSINQPEPVAAGEGDEPAMPTVDMILRYQRQDPSGKFPDEVEPALRFLAHFHAPNLLNMAPARGNGASFTHKLPVSEGADRRARTAGDEAQYVEALAEVQKHTDVELRIPDLSTESDDARSSVKFAALILRGQTVSGHWESLQFAGDLDADPEAPFATRLVHDLKVQIGDRLLTVGQVEATITAEDGIEVEQSTVEVDGVEVHAARIVAKRGPGVVAYRLWTEDATASGTANQGELSQGT